ncbi:MAG: flagellar basal-body MS-ring/collar protein FliF [Planctomycetota bacterium]|jgi:flagellar M-ring protein FliF
MNLLQKIQAIWEKVSLVQRALLIAVVLTFIIGGVFLFHWASQPDMRMLYQDLSPEEASKIAETISEKGIAYELRNGGTTIYAPRESVYQLRLDMAKEGLPTDGQSGYRIFDQEKLGVSPFVQGVNLKRALQDELAKSIQMIDGVVHARVHIVSSEQTLFTSEAGKTTASVVLRLKPGYSLNGTNVAAITHLVSGSVEGLDSEDVTVIDSQGRLLSNKSDPTLASGASTVQDYRERVEQNLSYKVEQMLTTVLGPGRATVQVSAVIDMNSTSIVTEIPDASTKVATKEEIQTGSEVEGGSASGEGATATPPSTKKDETIVTEFLVGKTVKQIVELPGTVKSLSVAACVDLSSSDVNDANSAGAGPLVMQVEQVEELIKNALGLSETDSLNVVQARFYRSPVLLSEEATSQWPRYIAIARQASLGIMALCALLVLRIFRGSKKKAAASAAVAPAGRLPEAADSAGLLTAGTEGSESLVLRQQISEALRNNPDQVKQLFSHWLGESES